ncbi:MAG: hypothetical protein HY267_01025 [Deltaproteobacteria bacterium]|nr:hypothetical protein [Deltaproteobacteria bacterium]
MGAPHHKEPECTLRFLYSLAALFLACTTFVATGNAAVLTSGDQFLHTAHHTDLFDTLAPIATAARAREVSSLTQTDFKALDTWTAAAADAALELTDLGMSVCGWA